MGLQKGRTNNPNGRPKGSENKVTTEIREKVLNFVNSNIDEIQANFNLLNPSEKVKYLIAILQYTIPKMKDLDHTITYNSKNQKS